MSVPFNRESSGDQAPDHAKGEPMRKFLPSGWRRYAIGFVVAGASLGVIGACQPTKSPAPKPVCFGGSGACLTIAPPSWAFTAPNEVHTFTVKNNGPDQSLPLFRG